MRTITIGDKEFDLEILRGERQAYLSGYKPPNRVRKGSCRRRLRYALRGTGVRFDCCSRRRYMIGGRPMPFLVFFLPSSMLLRLSNSRILDFLEDKLMEATRSHEPEIILELAEAA